MSIAISRLQGDQTHFAVDILRQFEVPQPRMDSLTKFLASDSHYFVAASLDNVCAGFAYAYELLRPDGSSMLFLYSIDVHPDFRRRGVATALVAFLRRVAEVRRMKELFVIAERSNEAAVALYRATGAVVEGGESLCFVYLVHDSAKTCNK